MRYLVRLMIVMCGFVVLTTTPIATIAQTTDGIITASAITAEVNQTIEYPITISCPIGKTCPGVELELSYDPTKIEVNSIREGGFLNQNGQYKPVRNEHDSTTGRILFVGLDESRLPMVSEGILVVLSLKPLAIGEHSITIISGKIGQRYDGIVDENIVLNTVNQNGMVSATEAIPNTFACSVTIPTQSVVRGQTVTGDIVCNNIPSPGVYGAQACFNITGVAITPRDGNSDTSDGNQLTGGAGTLFEGSTTLSLANSFDATGGCYGLTLTGNSAPVQGNTVLARFSFTTPNAGVVNFSLYDVILASYGAIVLPGLQLTPASLLTVVDGELASLQGLVRRQAGGANTTTRVMLDGVPSIITDNGGGLASFLGSDLPATQVTLSASSAGHLACSNPITLTAGANTLPSEIVLFGGETNIVSDGISVRDSVIIALAYSGTITPNTVVDINGDGRVSVEDIIFTGMNLDRLPGSCQP